MFGLLAKGGFLLVPIMLASVVSLAVIIERFLFWRRQRGECPMELLKAVESGSAVDHAAESCSPVGRVLLAGLEHRGAGHTLAMEAEAIKEVKQMNRYLPALDTIITLAPLLGLLGTIVGMIQSFGIMSETGLGNPLSVTGGVGEALIATAAGLTVAIMTLVPYNYFLAQAEKTTEDIERYSTRLEMILSRVERGTSDETPAGERRGGGVCA